MWSRYLTRTACPTTELCSLDGRWSWYPRSGRTAQRRSHQLEGVDVVAFADDDALLRTDYLACAGFLACIRSRVADRTCLLDGATKGEIPTAHAIDALAASRRSQ